jgi:hypothetical protein
VTQPLEVLDADVDAAAAEGLGAIAAAGADVGRLGVRKSDVGAVDDDRAKSETKAKEVSNRGLVKNLIRANSR